MQTHTSDVERVLRLYPKVLTRYSPIVVDHALAASIWDTGGQRWLDFTSGIAVVNTGHCHPRVVAAIREQAGEILHAQVNIMGSKPILQLSERLIPLLPGGLDQVMFSNSGAEAVEGAVKLARSYTRRPAVIAFRGAFHGRTAGTMALTSSRLRVRQGFEPLPAAVYMAPYPYAFQSPWRDDPERYVDHCLGEFSKLFDTLVHPRDVAAVIVEPVLGEGGYVPAPPSFLAAVRRITKEHGILLIVDEVQTGFGRTGKLFASEHYGLEPDIMTMAKGMASGLPMSAVAARREVFDVWEPGQHGGTFGGNPVCAAAAVATLDVIREEGLLENATIRGAQLQEGLRAIRSSCPSLGDVRGLGLMVAAEFVQGDGTPDGALVKKIVSEAQARRLLLLTAGTYDQVIRFAPPLVVTEEEIEEGLGIFAAAVAAAISK